MWRYSDSLFSLIKVSKAKLLLIAHLTLDNILLQSEGLLCILELLSIAIASAGNTQYIPVMFKELF